MAATEMTSDEAGFGLVGADHLATGADCPPGGGCCGPVAPYYLRAVACVYGSGGGECSSDPRPDLWVCTGAVISATGLSIRQTYSSFIPPGSPVGASGPPFTFIHAGWCYTAAYTAFDDGGNTASEVDAIASGLERIACDETIDTVPTNCNDPACPTGIGYVLATRCNSEGGPAPDVYVCAAQVRRTFVSNIGGFCYCVKPGSGIDRNSVPAGALRFDRVVYPEDGGVVIIGPGVIEATYRACCQCVGGCASAPLQGDATRICCCPPDPDAVLLSYVMDYTFTRTTPTGSGPLVQTVTGRAAPGGTPGFDFTYHYQFRNNGALQSEGDEAAPWTRPTCGFNTSGGWPPPTFVDYDAAPGSPPGFGFANSLVRLNLDPGDNNSGQWLGTFNASCTSYALEIIGSAVNPDTGQVLEVRVNINATFSGAPSRCRGNCGSFDAAKARTAGRVFVTVKDIEGLAGEALRGLLP